MSEENLKEVNWERDAIEKIALAAIHEQKRTRFWSLIFKGLTFIYLFLILFYMFNWVGGSTTRSNADHTALIDIQGEIGADQVNADSVISSLQEAYDHKHTKGIILRINSPGGSPVQAGIINDEINRQRKLHPKLPIYTVVDDICASGGYYIAVATEKIYVDKASIIGSIGVLMDGFGFTGAMEKFGVERRLMTAGENKAMLDPFSPLNTKHQALVQTMLNEIHQQFITVVRQGRGNRLVETPETFSGLFWSGESGIKMGLADGLGSMEYVAREVIKEPNIVDFTSHEDFADRLAKRLGASMTQSLFKGVSLH